MDSTWSAFLHPPGTRCLASLDQQEGHSLKLIHPEPDWTRIYGQPQRLAEELKFTLQMTIGLIHWYGRLAIHEYRSQPKIQSPFFRFGTITKNEGHLGLRRILAPRREKAEYHNSDLARTSPASATENSPLGG